MRLDSDISDDDRSGIRDHLLKAEALAACELVGQNGDSQGLPIDVLVIEAGYSRVTVGAATYL